MLAQATATEGVPQEQGTYDTGTGGIHYRVVGTGPDLVLIHDDLLGLRGWDAQVDVLARDFRVILFARRGYAPSDPPDAPFYTTRDMSGLLDRLGATRPILVGAATGARFAVDYALTHPSDVDALVLVSPTVEGLPYSGLFLDRHYRNSRGLILDGDAQAFVDAWMADPYLFARADTRKLALQAAREDAGYLDVPPGFIRFEVPDFRSGLGELSVPTLILTGDRDHPEVQAHAGAIHALIPGSVREIVRGAGHLPHVEAADEFNEELLGFLRPTVARPVHESFLPAATPFDSLRAMFAYDAERPLALSERSRQAHDGALVVDVTYESPRGGPVPSWLVLPPDEAPPRGGVVFMHPGEGDRSTFLDEAIAIARTAGVASVLPDSPYLRPSDPAPMFVNPRDAGESVGVMAQAVVDLRRAVDVLVEGVGVDPSRIGYVGHSLGGTTGAMLAAVEPRFAGLVLMAPAASLSGTVRWSRDRFARAIRALAGDDLDRLLPVLARVDPVQYVGHASSPLLLQGALRDERVPASDLRTLRVAAPAGTELVWYETGHLFTDAEDARRARWQWLLDHLNGGLDGAK